MASILPLLVILVGFWFLMIRPQQRRQAQLRSTIEAATPGTEVVLTSGIFGVIKERTEDHILVELADGVDVRILPAAIGQVVQKHDESDDADTTDSSTSDSTDTPAMFAKPDSEEN